MKLSDDLAEATLRFIPSSGPTRSTTAAAPRAILRGTRKGLEVARDALKLEGIDELGLDRLDHAVLRVIKDVYNGGPVGKELEGDMELEGVRHPRYRVWHPRDHVVFRYVSRPTGGAGPGAVFSQSASEPSTSPGTRFSGRRA